MGSQKGKRHKLSTNGSGYNTFTLIQATPSPLTWTIVRASLHLLPLPHYNLFCSILSQIMSLTCSNLPKATNLIQIKCPQETGFHAVS